MNDELLKQEVKSLEKRIVALERDIRDLNRAVGRIEGEMEVNRRRARARRGDSPRVAPKHG